MPVSARAQADSRSIQRSGRVTVDVFTNVTNEPADAWIGRGIAASLAADLNAIARDLDTTTDWHVRGAYQRLGTQIRITADLIDQTTEQAVSAAKVEGNLPALFALEDALADQLAHALRRAVAPVDPATVGALPSRFPPTTSDGKDASDSGLRKEMSEITPSRSVVIDGPPPPVPPAVASYDSQGRMTMRAIRLDSPLHLDGHLNESVYQTVPPVTDFVQQEPNEGAPATEHTDVWVMFDSEYVFVSFRALESDPTQMIVNEMRRDNGGVFRNANVAFIFDTFSNSDHRILDFGYSIYGWRQVPIDASVIGEKAYATSPEI